MKRLILAAILAVGVSACGADDPAPSGGADTGDAPPAPQAPADEDVNTGGEVDLAPSGPIQMNTIRVGGETWTRALDGSGQCVLPAADGGDPVDGFVWGDTTTADVNFSVSYGEASGNPTEAEVEGSDFWWVARGDDLVIEFDYDAMTISGSGTFENQLLAEDPRQGDFLFQCEPEG